MFLMMVGPAICVRILMKFIVIRLYSLYLDVYLLKTIALSKICSRVCHQHTVVEHEHRIDILDCTAPFFLPLFCFHFLKSSVFPGECKKKRSQFDEITSNKLIMDMLSALLRLLRSILGGVLGNKFST